MLSTKFRGPECRPAINVDLKVPSLIPNLNCDAVREMNKLDFSPCIPTEFPSKGPKAPDALTSHPTS